MTEGKPKRRPRGVSPRGNFERAKSVAMSSEEARVAADRQKTETLRRAQLSIMCRSSLVTHPQK
jgi:hypothetical protein